MPSEFPSFPVIPPGKTIGILGGGQLGRMTALAAARLGYRCHIFCPEPDCPASLVSATHTLADYTDENALARFASVVDVVTLEFENIPSAPVRFLENLVPVRPGSAVLAIGQDRIQEKLFFGTFARTAPWRGVSSLEELTDAFSSLGAPSVLKTNRFGYDGKGQIKINSATELADAWSALGGVPCILEGFISFEREISVIAARGTEGTIACYCPAENIHCDHILDTSTVPASLSAPVSREARNIVCEALNRLSMVGLLTIEMFVTTDGSLLVNEMAPRPHNSGHWTMDGCRTDQFEQLVRAICGLPLGSSQRHYNVTMKNLLGDSVNEWHSVLANPAARLHLYGKKGAKKGRKMGHVNLLSPCKDTA